MSLSVKFEQNWSHPEDPGGNNIRHYPSGLVVELPDDLAAAAIFEGAAAPARGEIPPDVQRYVDAYKGYVEQLESGATLEQAEANMAAALRKAGQADASDGDADADQDPTRTVEPVDPATGEVKPKSKGKRSQT